MDNERSGGSTRRMDMSDMADDPLGEGSADAVSAAEAGTSATTDAGKADAGAVQNAQQDLQMSDAIGDDRIGDDSGAQASASSKSSSGSSSGSTRGRIPSYALEMIAEHLRKRGHHNISADELDSALDETGFTVTPDPWHGYQPRSGPSLAESSIQQQQSQRSGGFISASPLGSGGSITLDDVQSYHDAQASHVASESSSSTEASLGSESGSQVSVAPALSQIHAEEEMVGGPVASTEHPQPASGLEASSGYTVSEDTATGPAAGMSDASTTTEPPDISLSFGAPAEGVGMSDEGPVQPPAYVDFDDGSEAATTDTTAASFGATADSYAPDEVQSASSSDAVVMDEQPTDSGASSDGETMVDAGSSTATSTTSSGGTGPVDAATTDMPMMPNTQVVGAGAGEGQQLAPHIRLSSGVEFAFGDKQEILVGREDPVSDIFPDVDLTGFGGEEGGVSRRHARIIRDGDTYLLEDLNSTNYTKLNGVKLIPKIPQAMRDGDHVSFGKVEATFHMYK